MRCISQTSALAREEVIDLLRRPRALLSLILHLGMVLLTVKAFLRVDVEVSSVVSRDDRVAVMVSELLSKLSIVSSQNMATELLSWPLSLPLLQFLLVLWLPTFVTLVSCDMVSTDLSRGTLRFILNRSTRRAYYVSKYLAHCFFHILLQALIFVLFVGATLAITHDVPVDRLFRPALTLFVLSVPYLCFLVAVTEAVSCLSKRPFVAILLLHIFWSVVVGVIIFVRNQPLLRWEYFLGLIVPFQGYGADSFVAFSVWGFALLIIGMLNFQRREV